MPDISDDTTLLLHHDCLIGATFPYSQQWNWRDCSAPATRVVYVDNFDVSPKPIHIPGNISVTLSSNIAHKLLADNYYRLNVMIEKKLLGRYHIVPCIHGIGSCMYDDLCETMQEYLKNHSCPQIVTDHGFTCRCPIDGISLYMNSLPARLNSIPPKFFFIASGDFKVRAELLHGSLTIGCLEVELTLSTPCTGFVCGR
ncbi:ganglioside GM2 activator-like [Mytilus trossulus]|uniref:ganglioside GM2 activator-like n=1 Tax=Mytilus trossulus TaxID=6551 RepID=UPI003005711A